MSNLNLGQYAKFITAAAGIAVTLLTQKYGGATWLPYVVGVASALGVYGVPNASPVTTLMTEVAGEVHSAPTPPVTVHLHNTPAPVNVTVPAPVTSSVPAPVTASGGLQIVPPTLGGQPAEFFESSTNDQTAASQPASPPDAAEGLPKG